MSPDDPSVDSRPANAITADLDQIEALNRASGLLDELLGRTGAVEFTDAPTRESRPICDPSGETIGHISLRPGRTVTQPQLESVTHVMRAATAELVSLEMMDRRLLVGRTTTDDILESILDAADARFPRSHMAIALSQPGTSTVSVAASRRFEMSRMRADLDSQSGRIGQTLRSGFPRSFPATRFYDSGELAEGQATITIVPMQVPTDGPQGVTSAGGVLLVVTTTESTLEGGDLEFLGRLGVHGAVLLENARLVSTLRRSEETYRTMVERAQVGMALLDPVGHVRHINGPLCGLVGENANPSFLGMVIPEDREAFTSYLNTAPGERADQQSMTLSGPDGPVPTQITITSLTDEAGAVTAHVLLVSDRTQQLAFEAQREALSLQIQQNEKLTAVGRFVAGIAHELNNPLTVVIGYAEIIAESEELDPQLRRSAEQILSHARRSGRVVEDLLKFARSEQTRHEPLLLEAVIEEALHATASKRRPEMEVSVQTGGSEARVMGSHHALTQVVVNILDNAFDAAARSDLQSPEVTVRLESDATTHRIMVEDCGPGISELKRIFEPFYTTKPIGQGTGLGLSICYGIIQDHQGELTAENLPGRGARVSIQLPRARAEQTAGLQADGELGEGTLQESVGPRRKHLLVIDDEPGILMLIETQLGSLVDVTTSSDCLEAKTLLEQGAFDAILCDVRMRVGPSGFEFFELVSREHPELTDRFAFVSGDMLASESRDLLAQTGRKCLEKPFATERLLSFVTDLIEG